LVYQYLCQRNCFWRLPKSGPGRLNLIVVTVEKDFGRLGDGRREKVPRRAIPLVAGEYYHIYNRGNNWQKIFFEQENYLFFLRRVRQYLLGEATEQSLSQTSEVSKTSEVLIQPTTIVAYCLMPNHFHLLVCPHDDDLSHRMQLFSISYTKAINKRYERTGALFQGQFQAVHMGNNDYLLHLSRYLHLNPVTARLVKQPEDWFFFSYCDFVGLRQGTLPRPDIILSQFSNGSSYHGFVNSYSSKDRNYIAHLLFED
jgi:putative transposase